MNKYATTTVLFSSLFFALGTAAQTEEPKEPLISVNVNVGDRSISKLPFVVAKEQGIYEKYGLAVDLRMSNPDFPNAVVTPKLFRARDRKLDFTVGGHAPAFMFQITHANTLKGKAIGSTDCSARAFIIGKKDEALPYDFKGKRIGASNLHTTTYFVASLLAKRKNLDPVRDLAIILGGQTYEELENDEVDAVVMAEINAAIAVQQGYKILEDTGKWNEPIAGNSVIADVRWLENPANRIKADNFMKAVAEALAIMHKDKRLTLDVLKKWYGIEDPELLEMIYERVRFLPKKPLVCVDGIKSTLALYKSNITDRYTAIDFYDDRFVNELESNGFFDSLYK